MSTDSSDNDTATEQALTLVRSVLDATLAEDALTPETAHYAVATCEVIARMKGHAGEGSVSAELVDQAVRVIDRLVAASEKVDLWLRSDTPQAWRARVGDVRSRLSGA